MVEVENLYWNWCTCFLTLIFGQSIESGINHYFESAPLREDDTERPTTEDDLILNPPLPPRVTEDGVSTPTVPPRPFIHYHENSGSPAVQGTSDNDSSDPTYSQPVLPKSSNTVPPPAATERLVYDDIQGFQNPQVIIMIDTSALYYLMLLDRNIGMVLIWWLFSAIHPLPTGSGLCFAPVKSYFKGDCGRFESSCV